MSLLCYGVWSTADVFFLSECCFLAFICSPQTTVPLEDRYYARAPKEAGRAKRNVLILFVCAYQCRDRIGGGLARKTGIISPRCDAVALCKQAAAYASRICHWAAPALQDQLRLIRPTQLGYIHSARIHT